MKKYIIWRWKKDVIRYAADPTVVGIHLLNSIPAEYKYPEGRDGFVGFEIKVPNGSTLERELAKCAGSI